MWRLVLNELGDSVRLTLCRPIKRQGRFVEDCPWSIAFEKANNWAESLKDMDFAFLMVAGLHEKLSIRDFTLVGHASARSEPRFESELLQQPPELIPGVLDLKSDSGRLIFKPVQVGDQASSSKSVWWMQTGDRSARSAAYAVATDNAGLALLSGSPASKRQRRKSTLPPLAAPPPTPFVPIKSVEFDESSNTASASRESSENNEPLWENWWNGVWQTRAALVGLPVSGANLSRVPALATLRVDSRHLLYRSFSIGGLARYSQDREGGELLVNTSLNRETQFATGNRKTIAAGATAALENACGQSLCNFGLNFGYSSVSTQWNYDREKTTLKVWTPQGKGYFLEPWFRWSSAGSAQQNGFIAEAR